MTREGFRRVARLTAIGAAGVACGALALQIIAVGWSGLLLGQDRAEAAQAAWAGSAAAASRGAEQLRIAGRPEQAQAAAIQALTISAQDSSALRTLAELSRERGQTDISDTAMVLAARLGWRDGFAQLWLFRRAIEKGDAVTAANAGDALLRTSFHPNLVRAPLYALIQTPAGRVALADRISGKPQWADVFLRNYRAETLGDGDAFGALLVELKRIGALPPDSFVHGFFQDLIARGRSPQAQAIWRNLTDGTPTTSGSAINDGDFDLLAQQGAPWGPFGWRVKEFPHIGVRTVARSAFSNDAALEVDASPGNSRQVLSQLLSLAPGSYTLSYDAIQNSGPRHAFRLSIRCLGKDGANLLRTGLVSRKYNGWRNEQFSFQVPTTCPGQTIALSAGSRSEAARATLDAVKVSPE